MHRSRQTSFFLSLLSWNRALLHTNTFRTRVCIELVIALWWLHSIRSRWQQQGNFSCPFRTLHLSSYYLASFRFIELSLSLFLLSWTICCQVQPTYFFVDQLPLWLDSSSSSSSSNRSLYCGQQSVLDDDAKVPAIIINFYQSSLVAARQSNGTGWRRQQRQTLAIVPSSTGRRVFPADATRRH